MTTNPNKICPARIYHLAACFKALLLITAAFSGTITSVVQAADQTTSSKSVDPAILINALVGDKGTKVAFTGDTEAGDKFQKVLNLIKSERTDLTIFLGDTSYDKNDDALWDKKVRQTLHPADPGLLVVGNHEFTDSVYRNIKGRSVNRLNNARSNAKSKVACTGNYAEKMTCTLNNLYFVISSIGNEDEHNEAMQAGTADGPVASRAEHERFINNSLNKAPTNAWRICAWHKNQRSMQVGGKDDEIGWTAYETCRKKGAIIATAHEHSYERTYLLSNMKNQSIVNKLSRFTVREGQTFAFVSGLGGKEARDQELSGNWWAKIYTSKQRAQPGVLFATFYKNHADFYFKTVNGEIIDKFTVVKGY